jgi:ABC-2 type transport system ATP-binding protein
LQGEANGTCRLRARPESGAAIAEDIGAMLRDRNIPVREVFVERGTLDDVFRKITAPKDFADA